jgi:hypothetical protein
MIDDLWDRFLAFQRDSRASLSLAKSSIVGQCIIRRRTSDGLIFPGRLRFLINTNRAGHFEEIEGKCLHAAISEEK